MSSLLQTFILLAVVGLVLIKFGSGGERKGNEPPPTAQMGYLAVIIGFFGALAQYMSFAADMLIFLAVAAALMLVDRLWLKKRRAGGPAPDSVEYARSFFPIILIVFLLRSFLAEPFQIPSSSMRPGLIPGDFILVNKFAYGLRIPVLNTVLIPVGKPERGDVMVFMYPVKPDVNFIKRVVGLPGDVVEYKQKQLFINGVEQVQTPVPATTVDTFKYMDDKPESGDQNGEPRFVQPQVYGEKLGTQLHKIFVEDDHPPIDLTQAELFKEQGNMNFPKNCSADETGFRCVVPAGHYFMMGDNRDNSLDSRYWGFVPDQNIVGKAMFIWMNFHALSRIGSSAH